MARFPVCTVLLLALSTSVKSQFFADLFQGFQPFVTNRPTLRQIYEQSTRRIKTDQNRGSNYRQTTRNEQTTKSYDDGRKSDVFSPVISIEDNDRRNRTNTSSFNNVYYTTTVKPKKIKDSSRRVINNGNKRDQATQSEYNSNVKEVYDGKINSISDYYTQKPNYESNNRATENYDRNNYYTTNNPLINRPGVRPAVVDNRPPITNRPVTKRPNYGTNPKPKDEDSIAFPEEDATPEIIIGPDEDNMSAVEKKRYIELAERMCDKYKSLTTKAVQAIPLLPSPEPVRVNVTACAPTTVPLVVGGKVVGIREFPHMALLGWRKLQGPGYSWKCGGSLVSDQFILTAAHCTYQDRDNTVVTGPPTAAQLGSSYLDDPGALVVRVAAVIRHPKYKQPRSYYDTALVKLVNAVKFSEVVKPACLGVPPAVGKSVIATGWGRTEYGGDQSHELRSVSLPVWSMRRCQQVLGTSRKLPDGPSSESQVCAGEERGGKDTCQGDSGGPAQLQEGCVWRVVAVTSLGRSCGAAETPGLYAKVHRAFVASQVFGTQSTANYGGNNQNYGTNNQNYDGNNQNYGTNQNYDGNSQNYGTNNQNYDSNNGQNYGETERPIFNRPLGQSGYTTTTTTRSGSNVNNNGQNGNRERPDYGYNQDSQNYNTQKPDRNIADYNNGHDSSNVNYGSNNRQQQNDYNQGTNSNSYTTRRPNRNDNSDIWYDNNYNNNYNRQQNSQNEYTTRKAIGNNGDREIIHGDYTNNNYNAQNSNSNNRDQSNYNRNGDYGINNGHFQSNQETNNNYGNTRRTNKETVNRPWWL